MSASSRQIAAADPARSTWLTANAGSGKTKVLTDRVARLLLAGVRPQNILCLTYTRAAAGEMQNRLFQRLGAWAMMPDDALAGELERIGAASSGGLAKARRLFAGAIETPGGLKIQTIHSFCASILRQFPLEAHVSPRFREIDERERRMMLRTVFDAFAGGPEAPLLAAIAPHCPDGELEAFLETVVGHATAFAVARGDAEILRWFGVGEGVTAETVRSEVLAAWDDGFVAGLSAVYSAGSATDQKKAAELAGWTGAGSRERFDLLCAAFLTKAGQVPKALYTKETGARLGALAERLERSVPALADALVMLGVLEEAQRTAALWRFGHRFCAAFAEAKLAAGVLDFDDLIARTLALLSDPGVADWVLYRLDGGIDHILVDEAQDTSPEQWAIIGRLAEEFASGIGARSGVPRTIFAVGDPKQSIYSFQGADPKQFEAWRATFRSRLLPSDRPLQEQDLLHSFRSSPAILELVDRVFGTGAPGAGGPTEHLAFHEDRPGRVDLWPLIPKTGKDDPPEWDDASARETPEKETLLLARSLAAEIARMLREEAIPGSDGKMRPVRAGDILILVRRRTFITDTLIAALKREKLPVAGADQVSLASDLAAMDIVAVLRFLDLPSDSLSLAAALRSPLFGMGERDLYELAAGRKDENLWDVLLAKRDAYSEAVEILEDLLGQADFLRPFELIERLLIRHRGRERLIARLGREIEEAIDILCDQAVAFEATGVPSLTGFLAWHEVDGIKVKRQLETGPDAIRVMTVHGAKGLEAPVVILPDTADRGNPRHETLARLADGRPVFRPRKERRPPALAAEFAALEQAQEEEEDRLFYVALTRPKNWLIVCGAGDDKKDERPSWHRQVASALAALGAEPLGEGLRLQRGHWGDRPAGAEPAPPDSVAIPDWAARKAAPVPGVSRPVSPSALGVRTLAPHAAEAAAEAAALRGRLLHVLLEHLPRHEQTEWEDLAWLLISQQDEPVPEALAGEVLAEARGVLNAAGLAHLFAGEGLNEVAVTAELPDGRRMLGRIDRLVRSEAGLLAIDYKSHAVVPPSPAEVPAEILVQLGCYAHGLRQVFPGTPVSVAVLWTRGPELMTIPDDMVTRALLDATTS